ncbi:MAG: VWA domain-containing protein [Planctomycetes bacterium]|nr:VWA domain-containing protein [Planctomycetota bacterium]
MAPASPLLALRLGAQDHALEPGRDYLLGSAPDCDFRLRHGALGHHARITVRPDGAEIVALAAEGGCWRNDSRIERAPLAIGDLLRLGESAEALVVPDHGEAMLVPVPTLRLAAAHRTVRIAARALRHEPVTFQDLMAGELRRAPWLALSVAVHLLVLLLLWLSMPLPSVSGRQRATVDIEWQGEQSDRFEEPPAPPAVVPEPEAEPFANLATPDPPAPVEVVPISSADAAAPRPPELPRDLAPIGRRAPPTGAFAVGGDRTGAGSAGFQRTVGELRKSGLEIVFVFDSTGSMTRTIHDTKSSITQMLQVLRTLVPDARIGLVTYRDRGTRERYVVRQMPLGIDPWRALNFMQHVTAEGGGDRPEDVRAGLQGAFAQHWRPGARRVVVLAGDAPPHEADLQSLLGEVRAFAGNGRSFVHTLVTSPDQAGADTHEAFEGIADAGKGTCQRLDDSDRVLQQVLTLAFGREFDRDIAEVVRAVEQEAARVDVQALALVRHGGPELARALRRQPLSPTLWNALVRRPQRDVAEQLVDLLADQGAPEPNRHAAAAALQQLLKLPLPPIDPELQAPPPPPLLSSLRHAVARLPE